MNTDPIDTTLARADRVAAFRVRDVLELIGEALPAAEVNERAAEIVDRLEALEVDPPRPGDRTVEGGMLGTLVACPTCRDGLLHRPDDDELRRVQPRTFGVEWWWRQLGL